MTAADERHWRAKRGQHFLARRVGGGDGPAGTGEEYLLYADRARCLSLRGATDRAALDAAFVLTGSLDRLSPDDRAVVEDSLSHYFASIGQPDAAIAHRNESKRALEAHMSTVSKLKVVLKPFSEEPWSSLDNQPA